MLLIISIATSFTCATTSAATFSPQSSDELRKAVDACIELSAVGNCSTGLHGPIGDWDVGHVTDMNHMFYNKTNFNQDLSKWDVSRVTDMSYMFAYAANFDQGLCGNSWILSKAYAQWMFTGSRGYICNQTYYYEGWYMYYYQQQYYSPSSPVSETDKQALFTGVRKCLRHSSEGFCGRPLGPLSGWNVSGVSDMDFLFNNRERMRVDLSKWDVSDVTTMVSMFIGAKSFNADLSEWDVSRVTDMHSMFKGALAFNADLSKWDVSKVIAMDTMFYQARSFNQTLCGEAWMHSKASKHDIFFGSNGSISECAGYRPETVTAIPAPPVVVIVAVAVVAAIAFTILAVVVPVVLLMTKKLSAYRTVDMSPLSLDLSPLSQQTDEMSPFETSVESTDTTATAHHVGISPPTHNTDIDFGSMLSNGAVLTSQHSALTSQHSALTSQYSALTSQYSALTSYCSALTSQHSALLFPIKNTTAGASRCVNLEQRTFATSNFKRCYAGAKAPMFQHRLLAAVHDMLKLYVRRTNPTLDLHQLDEGTNAFMKDIQGEAFRHNEVLQNDVGAAAEYLWTSAKTHAVVNYKQLYSAINAVIRDDVMEEVMTAVVFCRAINTRRVRRVIKGDHDTSYPRNGETWRGGGFRSQHRAFFERIIGKKYRVPGFLATSTERWVAEKFADEAYEDNGSHPCVIWRVTFDPRGEREMQYRVRHMTFVSKSLIQNEEEYLFAPYSVFTLVSARWSPVASKPHFITVLASCDNKKEDENLPLAPWY